MKQYYFPSLLILYLVLAGTTVHAAEKICVAYPAVAPGSTPSQVTAEKVIWQKYGFDVETILASGGARAVPAVIGI
jgi:ABC-type nitrate/sulfonate/bicarbonate transport system substrate-binding protein